MCVVSTYVTIAFAFQFIIYTTGNRDIIKIKKNSANNNMPFDKAMIIIMSNITTYVNIVSKGGTFTVVEKQNKETAGTDDKNKKKLHVQH